VLDAGWLRMRGFPAWLAWVAVHIYTLTGFRNRLFVLARWVWSYFTHRRGARLILGRNAASPPSA
jgi:NADH:quinone reductase (non-electrogenic)